MIIITILSKDNWYFAGYNEMLITNNKLKLK